LKIFGFHDTIEIYSAIEVLNSEHDASCERTSKYII